MEDAESAKRAAFVRFIASWSPYLTDKDTEMIAESLARHEIHSRQELTELMQISDVKSLLIAKHFNAYMIWLRKHNAISPVTVPPLNQPQHLFPTIPDLSMMHMPSTSSPLVLGLSLNSTPNPCQPSTSPVFVQPDSPFLPHARISNLPNFTHSMSNAANIPPDQPKPDVPSREETSSPLFSAFRELSKQAEKMIVLEKLKVGSVFSSYSEARHLVDQFGALCGTTYSLQTKNDIRTLCCDGTGCESQICVVRSIKLADVSWTVRSHTLDSHLLCLGSSTSSRARTLNNSGLLKQLDLSLRSSLSGKNMQVAIQNVTGDKPSIKEVSKMKMIVLGNERATERESYSELPSLLLQCVIADPKSQFLLGLKGTNEHGAKVIKRFHFAADEEGKAVVTAMDGPSSPQVGEFGDVNVVEGNETIVAWDIFLREASFTCVGAAFNVENVTIFGDRHVGIKMGLAQYFSRAKAALCLVHLLRNLKLHLKTWGDIEIFDENDFWAVALAPTYDLYSERMKGLREDCPRAATYLTELGEEPPHLTDDDVTDDDVTYDPRPWARWQLLQAEMPSGTYGQKSQNVAEQTNNAFKPLRFRGPYQFLFDYIMYCKKIEEEKALSIKRMEAGMGKWYADQKQSILGLGMVQLAAELYVELKEKSLSYEIVSSVEGQSRGVVQLKPAEQAARRLEMGDISAYVDFAEVDLNRDLNHMCGRKDCIVAVDMGMVCQHVIAFARVKANLPNGIDSPTDFFRSKMLRANLMSVFQDAYFSSAGQVHVPSSNVVPVFDNFGFQVKCQVPEMHHPPVRLGRPKKADARYRSNGDDIGTRGRKRTAAGMSFDGNDSEGPLDLDVIFELEGQPSRRKSRALRAEPRPKPKKRRAKGRSKKNSSDRNDSRSRFRDMSEDEMGIDVRIRDEFDLTVEGKVMFNGKALATPLEKASSVVLYRRPVNKFTGGQLMEVTNYDMRRMISATAWQTDQGVSGISYCLTGARLHDQGVHDVSIWAPLHGNSMLRSVHSYPDVGAQSEWYDYMSHFFEDDAGVDVVNEFLIVCPVIHNSHFYVLVFVNTTNALEKADGKLNGVIFVVNSLMEKEGSPKLAAELFRTFLEYRMADSLVSSRSHGEIEFGFKAEKRTALVAGLEGLSQRQREMDAIVQFKNSVDPLVHLIEICDLDCGQQPNGYDCGWYTCLAIERFAQNISRLRDEVRLFSQGLSSSMRNPMIVIMVKQILCGDQRLTTVDVNDAKTKIRVFVDQYLGPFDCEQRKQQEAKQEAEKLMTNAKTATEKAERATNRAEQKATEKAQETKEKTEMKEAQKIQKGIEKEEDKAQKVMEKATKKARKAMEKAEVTATEKVQKAMEKARKAMEKAEITATEKAQKAMEKKEKKALLTKTVDRAPSV